MMADLTHEQIKSLDSIRQRLLSLNASLGALRGDLATNPSLPSWSSLQSHATLISSNLQQINSSLTQHSGLLASTITFPSMQFPSRHQADVISTLLRTKMEPDVEEWLEEGQKYAKDANSNMYTQILRDGDRQELWQWAPSAANAEARKQKWGADYTLAEVQGGVEKVVTGLRRALVEPPEVEEIEDEAESEYGEEEEEEDEVGVEMDVDLTVLSGSALQPSTVPVIEPAETQMPMERVHRFMTTGSGG
jgi:mediator of RNA polymerase II transcription subunit 8, fungi type